MKISVIKYDYVPASGKQYDVRFADGASQRYVELTEDELRDLHEQTGHALRRDESASEPDLPVSWHAMFIG